jgi:hypothetical protein
MSAQSQKEQQVYTYVCQDTWYHPIKPLSRKCHKVIRSLYLTQFRYWVDEHKAKHSKNLQKVQKLWKATQGTSSLFFVFVGEFLGTAPIPPFIIFPFFPLLFLLLFLLLSEHIYTPYPKPTLWTQKQNLPSSSRSQQPTPRPNHHVSSPMQR